jgi:hypothetical protein
MYNPAPSTQERGSLAISIANKLVMGGLSPLKWQKSVSLLFAEDFTTLIHFVSRHENPFVSQELFQHWEIALSSFYQAIAKLNDKGILLNPSGRMLIDWGISYFPPLPINFLKNAKSLILRRQTSESVIFMTLSDESRGGKG